MLYKKLNDDFIENLHLAFDHLFSHFLQISLATALANTIVIMVTR